MTFRYFRKQRKGIMQMGHVPPYLLAADGPSALVGSAAYSGGLLASTDFGVRTVGVQGPNADNGYLALYDPAGTNIWVARIFPDTGGLNRSFDFVSCAADGVRIYIAFLMECNNAGAGAITYTLENSDGTVGATVTTSSNVAGAQRHWEYCVAAYDHDGNVVWAKRVYQIQMPAARSFIQGNAGLSIWVPPAQIAPPVIGLQANVTSTANSGAGTLVYRFGPGDANEQTATLRELWMYEPTWDIDAATGEIVAGSLNVAGPTVSTSGSALGLCDEAVWPGTVAFPRYARPVNRARHWYTSHARFVTLLSTTSFASDINGTPTAFLKPAAGNDLQGCFALLTPTAPSWAFVARDNSPGGVPAGDFTVCIGVDTNGGGVLFGRTDLQPDSARTISARDAGGDVVIGTLNHRGSFFFSYTQAGALRWSKLIDSTLQSGYFGQWQDAVVDGATVFAAHSVAFQGAAGLRLHWGAGEANATSYTYPTANWGAAVVAVDEATGDLQWAAPINPDGGNLQVSEIQRDGSAVKVFVFCNVSFQVDVLTAPVSINVGAGNLGLVMLELDASDGSYLSHTTLFTTASGNLAPFNARYLL